MGWKWNMTSSLKANKLRDTYYLNSQNKNKDTSFAFIFCKSGPKTKKKKKKKSKCYTPIKQERETCYLPIICPFPLSPLIVSGVYYDTFVTNSK